MNGHIVGKLRDWERRDRDNIESKDEFQGTLSNFLGGLGGKGGLLVYSHSEGFQACQESFWSQ